MSKLWFTITRYFNKKLAQKQIICSTFEGHGISTLLPYTNDLHIVKITSTMVKATNLSVVIGFKDQTHPCSIPVVPAASLYFLLFPVSFYQLMSKTVILSYLDSWWGGSCMVANPFVLSLPSVRWWVLNMNVACVIITTVGGWTQVGQCDICPCHPASAHCSPFSVFFGFPAGDCGHSFHRIIE